MSSLTLRKLDDYQSWALEAHGKRLLIDPWLTEQMSLPPGHWLFGRRRTAPSPLATWLPVDALVLTAHFSDHLDPATLSALPREVPVFASRTAARLVRRLGFMNVTALVHGQEADVWPGLSLRAVAPGFPYSHNSLGFVFSERSSRVYFETHMVSLERAAQVGQVDLVVAPVQSVRLLGMPFVMSAEQALEAAQVLAPQRWLPTGNDPQLAHGLLSKALLRYRGEVADFEALLAQAKVPTSVLQLAPGEALQLRPPGSSPVDRAGFIR